MKVKIQPAFPMSLDFGVEVDDSDAEAFLNAVREQINLSITGSILIEQTDESYVSLESGETFDG